MLMLSPKSVSYSSLKGKLQSGLGIFIEFWDPKQNFPRNTLTHTSLKSQVLDKTSGSE